MLRLQKYDACAGCKHDLSVQLIGRSGLYRYTLQDMREYGRKKGWCPYFTARHMLAFANVMVYNYQYMLDPKASTSPIAPLWPIWGNS